MGTQTSINFWLDLLSLLVMICLAATGGIVHYVLPAGTGHFYLLFGLGRHDFGQIHFYLAVAAIVLLALHVLLHWSWICGVIGKSVGSPAPSQKVRMTWGLSLLCGVVLFLGGGISNQKSLYTLSHRERSRHGSRYSRVVFAGRGTGRDISLARASIILKTPRFRGL